tara:strand:- start:269 stop:1150 length:882 start_codon:yes stop_codon:yes gene_type:complete
MATNVFFSPKVRSEQMLYEDLLIESLKIYGQDVTYIPRTLVNNDRIMGEAIASSFDAAYNIEMYIENPEGFDGEGDLFAKFGVEIRDQATLVVSRYRWEQLIGIQNNLINANRPAEGDLIYLPLSNSLFEIAHVEHEQPFYQLSQWPTYKIRIEKFEYANETLNTGIDAIDDIDDNFAYGLKLVIDNSNGTDLSVGESITQTLLDGTIITGEVVNFSSTFDVHTAIISHIKASDNKQHSIATGINIVGSTSTAAWNVVSVADSFGDTFNKNAEFDTERNDILDFAESNPFGEL